MTPQFQLQFLLLKIQRHGNIRVHVHVDKKRRKKMKTTDNSLMRQIAGLATLAMVGQFGTIFRFMYNVPLILEDNSGASRYASEFDYVVNGDRGGSIEESRDGVRDGLESNYTIKSSETVSEYTDRQLNNSK